MASFQAAIPDASFGYAGESAAGFDSPLWRASAASVTGPSHAKRGAGCDDAAAAACAGRWLVAAVCDGAGSADHGGAGAGIVAESIVHYLMAEVASRSTGTSLRSLIRDAMTAARLQVLKVAGLAGLEPFAYATTVVGVLCRDGRGIFFHLGDGAAVALDTCNAVKAISRGSPQEYANETYFLTDEAWREHLRFSGLSGAISVMLMTDGVTPFALNAGRPKEAFIEPIQSHLTKYPAQAGAEALRRMLDSADARRLVSDDKTLLWASTTPPAQAGADGGPNG